MDFYKMLGSYQGDVLFNKPNTTIDTYIRSILFFLKWVDESGLVLESSKEHKDGISKIDLQDYVHRLEKRKSASTVRKDWAAVLSFLRWKELGGLTKEIKLPDTEDLKKEAPGFLEDNVIKRIIREEYRKAERTDNWRDAAIVIILAHFGLRINEVVLLELDNIKMSDRKGEVKVKGKGNKHRTIPFPEYQEAPRVREILGNYLKQRLQLKTEEDALFMSNRGNRLSKRAAQNVIEKHGVNCHSFRHSYITKMVRQGVDFSLIMSLTGHSSMEMVARYSSPSEDDKIKAISKVIYD